MSNKITATKTDHSRHSQPERQRLPLVMHLFVFICNLRGGICCPAGYTWCQDEHSGIGNCDQSGVIAYGTAVNNRYTFQTSSASIMCDNSVFGDPRSGITKECCYQTPTFTGPVSPIVGTISCDQTIYSFFNQSSDVHYWKLTTSNFNDITYSLCDSTFNTEIFVHNSEGTVISLPYCDGNNCNENMCSSSNKEYFTITSQLPDTYYIQINSRSVGHGDYDLSVSCSPIEQNFDAVGCWVDMGQSRAMSVLIGTQLTIQDCNEACLKYKYFGMENGWECWCDNSFASASQHGRSTTCNACTNTAPNCPFPGSGGGWALNVYHNQYDLIFDHKDVANGYFSANLNDTGLENEGDPTANTYCIIGNIDPIPYRGSDGKYTLKLIYKYSDATQDVLNWKQSSWVTDSVIVGADLFDVPAQTSCDFCDFEGLGLSTDPQTYIDGDGSGHDYWYQSVGSNQAWNGGIPGFNEKVAYSSSLYVLNPIIPTLSPTPAPTNVPTTSPTPAPTQQPTMNPTPAPTGEPSPAPTENPTAAPTPAPTINPTAAPSVAPIQPPSMVPTFLPTAAPTLAPSINPSNAPTAPPSVAPSDSPTIAPSTAPTVPPTYAPTGQIIVVGSEPTPEPTETPVTTTGGHSDDSNEGETDGKTEREQNGLLSHPHLILMIILATTAMSLICCCCFMLLLLYRKRRKRKQKTIDFNENRQGEGVSNGTGLTTKTNMNSGFAESIEMENVNPDTTPMGTGYDHQNLTRVNSASAISNAVISVSNPNSPYGITATPYEMQTPMNGFITLAGMSPVTNDGNTPNAQQLQFQNYVPELPPSRLNLNEIESNDQNEDILDEDEDDLNGMYGRGNNESGDEEQYGRMYGTSGGPATAGQ